MNHVGHGRERHACGCLRKIKNENWILFYTGGNIRNPSSGYSYTGSSGYESFFVDLDNNDGWNYMKGTLGATNIQFVRTSPYNGFAFNYSPYLSTTNWYVWNEYKMNFFQNTHKRLSLRREFAVAGIPKSSPYVKNCHK